MTTVNQVNEWLVEWGVAPSVADVLDQYVTFAGVLLLAFAAGWGCRVLLLRIVTRLVRNTKATWDDIIFDRKVLIPLSRMAAPLIITSLVPVAFAESDSWTLNLIMHLCEIYILLSFLLFVNSLLKAVYTVYSNKPEFRNRPLKGLLQTFQVALWFVGGIIIIAILLGKSPLSLLAGLGASAAVLMLVFKDSIMGLVSGVQLSANDMLKVGDWITMPRYGADGTVVEVTLNTVKVRNWDNTITTVPPYLLVSDSFQNWRGMQESGGRRVKRSVNIDMNSVAFCTPQMLQQFRRIELIRDYIDGKQQELEQYNRERQIDDSVPVNGRRQTNLGVFRAYLTAYLKSLPQVNQQLTVMVRQLQPTDRGLPMELYFFSQNKEWVAYESIQADVFDHVLAVIPQFGLRVFQSPSGADLKATGDAGIR